MDQHSLSCSVSAHLAGFGLPHMQFSSLIQIAALGSGSLNLSYIWHVSPVSFRASLHPAPPRVAPAAVQLLCADSWALWNCFVSRTSSALGDGKPNAPSNKVVSSGEHIAMFWGWMCLMCPVAWKGSFCLSGCDNQLVKVAYLIKAGISTS